MLRSSKPWPDAPRRRRGTAGAGIVVIWACACSALLWDCSRERDAGREPVVVFGLDDQASGAPKGVRFDLEHARRVLEDAIESSEKLRLVEEKSPEAFRAELTIELASERESQRPEEDGVYRAVQVSLNLSRWKGEHERETLASQGKAFLVQDPKHFDRPGGFEKVLDRAIDLAVEYIDLQLKSRGMTAEGLEKLLGSDRTEDRLYVLRTLRDRPDTALVPKVIEMLQDPDPDVAKEAVGVLVAHKDRRAALPLIRMTQGRDQIFLLQIITALAEIQGPVARGYLHTLAAGHGSVAIRERAREALDRLLREEGRDPEPKGGKKTIALPRTKTNDSTR